MKSDQMELLPAEGIKAINWSLRCFGFSMASLIPILGLPMALVAFSHYRRTRALLNGRWNPAQSHLVWGAILSGVGMLISLMLILILICALLKLLPGQYANG